MKKSLQKRLVNYLKARPHQPIAKGFLADLARAKGGYTGETVGRRLRILAEVSTNGVTYNTPTTAEQIKAKELLGDDKITVEHRTKNHSFYSYLPSGKKTITEYKVENGVARAYQKTIVS